MMDVVEVARTYLDALVSHDAESVLLAEGARRIDNGKVTVQGADALRAIIRREPAARTDGFRWIVDGDQAIAFYDLDADLSRGEGEVVGPPDSWIPAYIGERFRVQDGRITEIEVVYTARPGHPRPERPARHRGGDEPRGDVLAAAQAYVASLVTHDPTAVPLHDDVWRIENGAPSGDGADALRAALASDVMGTIQGIGDETWFAGGDGAAVFYTLTARVSDTAEMQVRIAERFRVFDGRLASNEAVFAPIAF
jgi:hypothetical protein